MPGALDRSPRANWVERNGGLPSYVERIAKHLLAKGMPMSRAIATAISTSKKWCATGEVHQWPGVQNINMGSRAEACKAVAEWEALKARARASKGGAANMSHPSEPCCSDCARKPLDLAFDPLRDPQGTTTGGQFTADPAQAKKSEAEANLKRLQEANPADRAAFLAGLTPEQMRNLFFALGAMSPPGPPWLRGIIGGELARRGMPEPKNAQPGDYDLRTKAEKSADKKRASGTKKQASSGGSSGGSKSSGGGSSDGGSKSSGSSKSPKSSSSSDARKRKMDQREKDLDRRERELKKREQATKSAPKPAEPTRDYIPIGGGQVVKVTRSQRKSGTTPASLRRARLYSHPGTTIELAGPSVVARRRMASQGIALDDGSFPIPDVAHLRKAIKAVGRASDFEKAKRHIRKRARALNATHLLPEGW